MKIKILALMLVFITSTTTISFADSLLPSPGGGGSGLPSTGGSGGGVPGLGSLGGNNITGCVQALLNMTGVEGQVAVEGAFGTGGMNFTAPLTAILQAFHCTNQKMEQGFASLLQAQQHIAESQINAQAASTTGIVAGIQTTKNNLHLGAQNLPHGACDNVYVANNAGAAGTQTANEAYYLNSKAEAYDNSVPATGLALNAQLMQTPATLTPLAIFGGDDMSVGSTLQSVDTGQQFIVNATNPIPLPPVPANELGGPAGTQKLAQYNFQHTAVATAQKALNDILALRAPVSNLSVWQQGVLSALGMQTMGVGFNPMNTTTGNTQNSVSMQGIIGTLVAQRFADPQYFTAVSKGDSTQAVKILAQNSAIELSLLYQMWLQLQNQSAVQAEILGHLANYGRY